MMRLLVTSLLQQIISDLV